MRDVNTEEDGRRFKQRMIEGGYNMEMEEGGGRLTLCRDREVNT